MLIKEISKELAVIITNNNKVLSFPLNKSSWKERNKFLGQLQLLQDLQQWRCSVGSPDPTVHLATVDLLFN